MDIIDDLILLKIFSYLPIRDLKSQAITCQKWNILIKETIKTRKQTIQSILFNNDHNLDSMKCQQNNFPNSEYFKTKINEQIFQLMIQADFCLLFVNPSFESHFINCTYDESKNRTKRKRLDSTTISINHLRKIFNLNNGFLVSVPGIIGTDVSNSRTIEIDDDLNDALSGILFPNSDYYRIVLKNIKTPKETMIEEFKIDKTNETINYVLILSKSFLQINKLVSRNNLNCPISGGFINKSYSIPSDPDTTNLTLISFITTKTQDDIRVAQVVIPDCDDLSEFDKVANQKLNMLKNTHICMDKVSRSIFALCMMCCGKGKRFHNQDNHESNLFKKYFPHLKLVGFYANGEIGFDHLPDYSDLNNNNNKQNFKVNIHELRPLGFTTVFTILSIKI
jgi:hypothetical protein